MLEKPNHTSGLANSKTESKCLKIRAHHLCCIQGFQGYGYSPAFVSNMRSVIANIEAFPSRYVKLVSECDALCLSCPSKRECSTQKSILSQKIRDMDLAVMKKLNIEEGTVMQADKAFRLIKSKLDNALDVEDICGTCKWRQKCLWYTTG